jgi:uncharacterized membrane protein YfcA
VTAERRRAQEIGLRTTGVGSKLFGGRTVDTISLVILGLVSGAGAGLLAGLVGIGGGIVIVPVVYYGLIGAGFTADEAAHVAVATSLAAILPAAIASSIGHWRAGNTDLSFIREWGPGIAIGVIAAQLTAPYVRGSVMTALFALFAMLAAARFAAPGRFQPLLAEPPNGTFRHCAGLAIGVVSGFAGVGGGIMTNIVLALSGLPIHKSIGRAAAVGVVVSVPATLIAVLGSTSQHAGEIGLINLSMWACIAPAQAVAAWFGAQLAQRMAADHLSRIFAAALAATGFVMLHSSVGWP